ncbi:MAG: hypothetical protein JWN54_1185 [Mycobacterium sp.]|jgi:uncharacterized protein (TIGR03083 family)|nr:hypothetical protein [Mycobacterium sp.]
MPPASDPAHGGPDTPHMGLLDGGPAAVRARVEQSWNAFLAVAETADLDAPSRLPGWRGHEVCTHLGLWDRDGISHVLASARGDAQTPQRPRRVDADNEALVRAHRDASREDVLAAVRRNRDQLLEWLETDEAAELGRTTAMSPIGPLPLLTATGASSYELAVHALDLRPCGAAEPDPVLLRNGLGAVLDVTGHLAHRRGLSITVTATSPDGGWTVHTDATGWTVEPVPDRLVGTGVRAELADLVDATAGRASVPALLATRRMTAHDLPGFLRLASLVEDLPGLPGGAALRAASRTLGGAESAVRGLAGMLGRGLSRLARPHD